ncbi:MAG: hypothetical protein HRU27_07405, partial [Rhizobiaceae bacterium]|nr:hypothetical protein [Rhizobiaceae bacterium]
GYAVIATEHELRRAASLRQQAEDRRLVEAKEWQEVADGLKEQKVRIEVRTGPTGRLYGSVTNTMIAEKLGEMTRRQINQKMPIGLAQHAVEQGHLLGCFGKINHFALLRKVHDQPAVGLIGIKNMRRVAQPQNQQVCGQFGKKSFAIAGAIGTNNCCRGSGLPPFGRFQI